MSLVRADVSDLAGSETALQVLSEITAAARHGGKEAPRISMTANTLENERGVLACIIQGAAAGANVEAAGELSASDFSDALHRRMFACFSSMLACGEPLTLPAIYDRMRLDGEGAARLAALTDKLLVNRPEVELPVYVRQVKQESRLRAVRMACEKVIEANGDASGIAVAELLQAGKQYCDCLLPQPSVSELFHSPDECENVPEIQFAISGFLQNDGMTFIGGLSGHAKTWIALSIVKALLTGKGTKLWSLFSANETAERVVYLIPEVGLASFMSRARRMGLLPFIKDRRLLVRTLSKGPAPKLDDPRVLAAVKGAHVVLDTAVRFLEGEINSASDNARGLAADVFALLTAGARTVICAHHSPKAFEKQNVMSLQGILAGTGNIGAMATTVWGVKQLDEPQNIVYMECVKARDFQHCEPFQLRGRPEIDEIGDFELYRAPGESGSLAEEQPAPANESKQRERDDRVAMVRAWMKVDPNLTAPEIVSRFAANGINVNDGTVRKYRIDARKNL